MIRQKWIVAFLIGVIAHVESGSQDFRLPEYVIPDHYRIKILTDLSDNFFYNGEVCIDFLVKTPTNKIVLHSKNLKIFENETKLEEYGKFMPHMNEKILRKPKDFSWGAAEFRNRPLAEYHDEEFRNEPQETERVLATEKKKPDVDFVRYEAFEKQSQESLESVESSESVEDSSEEKIVSGIKDHYKPLPLPTYDGVRPQKLKEESNTEKITLSPVKPQTDRRKVSTTESSNVKPSTVEYTKHPHEFTTMDDKTPPVKNQNDRMKYTTTDRTKFTTNEHIKKPAEDTVVHTTTDRLKYTTNEHTKKPQEYTPTHTTTERIKYTTNEYNSAHTTTTDRTRPPVKNENDRIKYTTTERIKHSTQGDTKDSQEISHPTRQPSRTQTDKDPITDVTYSEMPEHSTAGYTKQSTTHPTTMDDKIHFTTHPPMKPTQHSTVAKQESTKQPPVEIEQPAAGFPMEGTAVKVPEESYSVLKHEFDIGNDFLVVHLDKPLAVGKKYRLYLTYQGVLTDTLTGFHRVPYLKRGSSKSTWLASTVFEPNEARTAFPCFDEPALKATFDVTLGHDKKYTALSNMPLKTKTQMEGKPEWQWSEFETTPPMSTYTVAFLISDLEYLTPRVNYTENSSNVTYRFWSRPDVLYKTRYAMRIAPEMKNYLEKILGVRDVLPKHDFVALPNFISSALENWGLYSFAEKNLLFTSGFSSIFSKFEITHVVGHEIAHMWFGNMVTPRWWDQIWLSEGLSNFFEIIAADHVQPTWDLKTVSVIFSYLKVFTYDALHTSHPLVPKLDHPNDLNEIFDSITYQKGFYMMRMLNYTLGQEAFMNGIRHYLKDHLLSTVDENDLWDALTESAHQEHTLPAEYNLRDLMYSWTRRTGYPIIDVIRDYDNHTANLTQRRFVRSKNDYEFRDLALNEEEGETKWWIPLTYTTGSELNFKDYKPRVWLNPKDDYHVLTDMPSKSDFVLMNLDAAGLYRVNYDERNWELIISYLINENSSDISVLNRVQILDDLLDLARAGEISYERALDATSYLAKEKHFLPWKAALSNFDFISRMLRSTDSNKSFKKFVRNMVAPRFEELGFESVRNEPLSDGLNRKQIAKWACKTGVRSCTRKSISLFKKWTQEKKPDEHNPIPSNLRNIVYCTAIENGGSKDWQFLWQRYLSNVVTDRSAILYGLGCSKSTRTLRKLLDWSIKETSGIKKQDTPTVFKSVVKNDLGFNLAKTFLRERMGDLKSYIGNNPFYLPQMIESMAAKMNEPADLEELQELEQAHFSHLRTVPRSFRQATERVRFNINWIEKNFKPIHDWLKKQRM